MITLLRYTPLLVCLSLAAHDYLSPATMLTGFLGGSVLFFEGLKSFNQAEKKEKELYLELKTLGDLSTHHYEAFKYAHTYEKSLKQDLHELQQELLKVASQRLGNQRIDKGQRSIFKAHISYITETFKKKEQQLLVFHRCSVHHLTQFLRYKTVINQVFGSLLLDERDTILKLLAGSCMMGLSSSLFVAYVAMKNVEI